jgi:3'-phosphoadenosine 5'-phosphosulfate sulfotransferase (PAPS reductase)/FAD synthetase
MQTTANEVDAHVRALISEGALFVVNHSGGKDSQAMMIRLLGVVPPAQMLVVHAALGDVEWPGAMELAEQQAAMAGVPFVVARAVKSFFDMVERRFRVRPGPNSPCWPSASNRQCTSDLKRGPIEREVRHYAKAHGYSTIVSCMGIRAQESSGRAKLTVFRKHDRESVAGRSWFEWLPIHSLSRDDVFATIQAAGQEPHWADATGNDRLSCVFCIMGSARDLANGARHRPDLLAKYLELEQRTGYTMHMSRKPLPLLIAEGGGMSGPSASPTCGLAPPDGADVDDALAVALPARSHDCV